MTSSQQRGMFLANAALAMLTLLLGCAAKGMPAAAPQVDVLFTLLAPDAASVCIVGTFNQWDRDRHRLSGPDQEGRWRATLPLLPGRHEYLFLLNGTTWMLDPSAPFIDDGMGGRNSVVVVPPE